MGDDIETFNAFEAAGWETRASDYDRFFRALTSRLADPLLDAVGATAGMRLLDIASGPGYVAGRAAERGLAAVGVDIAEAMVDLARRMYPKAEFRRADAQSLPFDDAAFDAVVSNLAIMHLGYPERAVAGFARVLIPGGKLALTAWDRPERFRLVGVLLEATEEAGAAPLADVPTGPDFFRFSEDGAFEALFEEQEMTDVEVTRVAFTHRVETSDELWEGLLRGTVRMSSHVLGQPDETRDRIRTAFERHMDDYRHEEGFELPVSVKLAVGRRR
jgi:ubiquinone/menaquinone biosynthesis C-methylase UbiE